MAHCFRVSQQTIVYINSFLSSCEVCSFPLKPQIPTRFSVVQDYTDTSFCLTVFGIPCLCGPPYRGNYILLSPANWSHVSLILSPAKKTMKGRGKSSSTIIPWEEMRRVENSSIDLNTSKSNHYTINIICQMYFLKLCRGIPMIHSGFL